MAKLSIIRNRIYNWIEYSKRFDSHKVADILVWATIAIAFSLAGFFTFDSLYPPKLLTWEYRIIQIAKDFTHDESDLQTFHPGDIVPLRLKGHKYTNDAPIISIHLVYPDSIKAVTASRYNPDVPSPRARKGQFNFVSLSYKIPLDAPSGIPYFEITYIYHRNFIRDNEVYTIRTEPFRVAATKDKYDEIEDEILIRKILKEMRIKPGEPGPKGEKGDKGDTGKRGPGLFGK